MCKLRFVKLNFQIGISEFAICNLQNTIHICKFRNPNLVIVFCESHFANSDIRICEFAIRIYELYFANCKFRNPNLEIEFYESQFAHPDLAIVFY